jgi:hypothetical protein
MAPCLRIFFEAEKIYIIKNATIKKRLIVANLINQNFLSFIARTRCGRKIFLTQNPATRIQPVNKLSPEPMLFGINETKFALNQKVVGLGNF